MNGQMRVVVGAAVGLMLAQVVAVGAAVRAARALPGGGILTYSWYPRGDEDIYVFDLNTGIEHALASGLSNRAERDPAWSPDGTQIAFSALDETYVSADIFVMDMDGSNLRQLTYSPGSDSNPVWSPDGSQIAFLSFDESFSDIYVMNADGSNIRQLTNSPLYAVSPSWSPDGKQIAFSSYREGSGQGIHMMNADGSNERQLIEGSYLSPRLSPDGRHIAFLGGDSQAQIFVMGLNSGALETFTVPVHFYGLTWLPDSRQIAYVVDPCLCGAEVYLLDVDTGSQYRFPFGDHGGIIPVWRPG